MKPAPFTWHGPESVAEATAVLAQLGSDAKVLAGGQSLIPVLAMRLAEPAHLVDINRLGMLDAVASSPAGVRVGALARHTRVEHDADAAQSPAPAAAGAADGGTPDNPESRDNCRIPCPC